MNKLDSNAEISFCLLLVGCCYCDVIDKERRAGKGESSKQRYVVRCCVPCVRMRMRRSMRRRLRFIASALRVVIIKCLLNKQL